MLTKARLIEIVTKLPNHFKSLGFVAGVCWLQQQATLPESSAIWILPLLVVLIAGFANYSTRLARFINAFLIFCFFLTLGFLWAGVNAHWRLADELPEEWEGRDIAVTGVIAKLPEITRQGIRFQFDIEKIQTEGAYVPKHILITWYQDQHRAIKIQPGERWQLTVRLKRPHGNANPYVPDTEIKYLERNIRAIGYVRYSDQNIRLDEEVRTPFYFIERLRDEIRKRFNEVLSDHPYSGVLIALAIGDQRAIPKDQWTLFIQTGTSHLMAISGLHVTMISGIAFTFFYWLWCRFPQLLVRLPARKFALSAGLVIALGYVLLSGFAIPARRAFLMLCVIVIGLWQDRRIAVSTLLKWALIIVVMLDPWAVTSPGFWLSFGAMAWIAYIAIDRIGSLQTNKISNWITIQWVITIGLVPLLLILFQQFSLISPVANALMIPLVSLAVVPLTVVSVMPAFDFLLIPAHLALTGGMTLLQGLSELADTTWQQHQPPLWAIIAAMLGIFWFFLPGGRGLFLTSGFPSRWLGIMGLLPLFLISPPKPSQGELWVTVLDVGQGLSIVVQTENHVLLFDTGPRYGDSNSGERIIIPFLRGAGIQHIDQLVISHADSDHSGGLSSILGEVPVKTIVSSVDLDHPVLSAVPQSQPCRAGDAWIWDGVLFEFLYPLSPERKQRVQRSRQNNSSCVLKITTAGDSILIPADIEKEAELDLLRYFSHLLPSTVLIAPHHGSKTSSQAAFIQSVNPQLTIFTVGYRNHLKHPNQAVVERYQAIGSQMMRSDYQGAITLQFSQHGFTAKSWRETKPRYWYQ